MTTERRSDFMCILEDITQHIYISPQHIKTTLRQIRFLFCLYTLYLHIIHRRDVPNHFFLTDLCPILIFTQRIIMTQIMIGDIWKKDRMLTIRQQIKSISHVLPEVSINKPDLRTAKHLHVNNIIPNGSLDISIFTPSILC
jgi:hypothetical protein